jgi:hypothetical protein
MPSISMPPEHRESSLTKLGGCGAPERVTYYAHLLQIKPSYKFSGRVTCVHSLQLVEDEFTIRDPCAPQFCCKLLGGGSRQRAVEITVGGPKRNPSIWECCDHRPIRRVEAHDYKSSYGDAAIGAGCGILLLSSAIRPSSASPHLVRA